KPIFIVNDGGQNALNPEFAGSAEVMTLDLMSSETATSEPMAEETVTSEPMVEDVVTPEPMVEETVISEPMVEETVISEPISAPISAPISNPVNIPNSSGQSVGQQGQFAYGEAVQKNFLFFEANRSGALPADNRLEWRSDSTTNDGSDVGRDLNGGYFDAGDHIKFIQPMAFSSTMLAWGGADYKQAYAQAGQLDELLEAVKWSTDWFLKAHEMDGSGNTERLWVQVGDKTDHYHWVPAEEIANKTARPSFSIDRNRPGSDAAAGTASALASAAVLFRGTDDAYADELVKNAEALYEFAENYRGKYSDSVPQASPFYTSWSGDSDELALGGAWLYRATGDSKYLSKAENYFKNEVGGLGDWSYATDDHSYSAATLLAKESSDPFFKNQTKNWLDTWVEGRGSVNYTSGGFAHRANWASVPLTMSAAFSAEWYNDNVEANSRYSNFANDQTDYVLGDNPANFSYVVGFGDNYAKRTHHRSSAGSANLDGSDRYNDHLLYGAVVGGPGSANDFSHNDRRNDWITNEVGTSYNAPFAGAAIQQYDNLGGDPLSESDLDQLIGIDANGVGF
ncbi:MAG: glycoside hydrolase family 9 protein, partial [Cyanobacteria bacterium J06553_1]